MNIHDVAAPEERPACLLSAMFDHQREHMKKYLEIEGKNGIGLGLLPVADRETLLRGEGLNLHERTAQYLLKDYCWRVTEEFTEATDAIGDREHYLEELIDGLHFLVELMILAGYQPEGSLADHFDGAVATDPPHSYDVIERIGCACNLLKNKPWKQTHMLTDIPRFYGFLLEAWTRFVTLLKYEGLNAEDMYNLYFRKSEVNKFRQRSKY